MPTALPTDLILPHLRELQSNAADLREIRLMWRLIEASARMQATPQGQALMSMLTGTRQGLERLEQGLLQSQLAQSARQAMAQLGMQSAHAIDLLVRSLYERTADVGFLAADTVLCEAMADMDDGLPDDLRAWQAPLQAHLQAYRAKYTVYDDILLLDVQGQVCARTQERRQPPACLDEAWFQQALQQAGHVSHFGTSSLLPGADRLLYAQRLLHPRTMAVLGVLCLSFDFAAEMQAIFATGASGGTSQVGLLLDAGGQVIASSDAHWIAPGSQVPMHHSDAAMPHIHAGRTYLVRTARALPYQGYAGPEGWQTQVMVPLELAFTTQQGPGALQNLAPAISQGLMAQARSFCPPLHAVAQAADDIRRVVWNGQVLAASQAPDTTGRSQYLAEAQQDPLQAVLEQMGETGDLTHAVFTRSIHNLHETALSTRLREHATLNRLLMDLLERNLYERANDCRWWALTPGLRAVLENNAGCLALTVQAHDNAQRLLEQLNALYTVYARIALYDAQGLVLACSHDDGSALPLAPGSRIEAPALQATLGLRDAQACHVQQFDDAGLPVHIYHAAIRATAPDGGPAPVIGGIALLFHTRRELQAMLQAGAPGHGGMEDTADSETDGIPVLPMEAFYMARDGRIIAASHDRRALGSRIEGLTGLASLADGEVRSSIEEIEGHYCVVGMAAGRGYREFRLDQGSDGGELAGLVSLSLQRLGPVHADARHRAMRLESASRMDSAQHAGLAAVQHGAAPHPVELASFYVGASLLALRATEICEALPASAVAPVAAGRLPYCVGALARRNQGSVSGYVWVFDLAALLQGRPGVVTEQSQVIVVQHGGLRVGLLVSALQGVHRLPASALVGSPMAASAQDGPLIPQLVHAGAGLPLIECLDPAALMRRLQPAGSARAQAGREAVPECEAA